MPDNNDRTSYPIDRRRVLADFWLGLPDEQLEYTFSGKSGEEFRDILKSKPANWRPAQHEQAFSRTLSTDLARGFRVSHAIQKLLAAMLYMQPEQLPRNFDLEAIPGWLMNDYLDYMFAIPELFRQQGEADNYCKFMQEWMDYLHARILENAHSEFWLSVARVFTRQANFIPLYFNESNLKDVYSKRADIIEHTLKQHGAEIDYTFPARQPIGSSKIRLGILAMHLGPVTETFATIPSFEHIDRTRFDITIYLTNPGNYPLEQHCRTLVDNVVSLDRNLKDQVATIRKDNLDILMFTTNTTAVANPVTFLAMHRLARIQVTSFNSPVTTGCRHIDYYLTGSLTDPLPGGQAHYREQLLNLDGPGFCFSYSQETAATGFTINRHDLGITEAAVVFISCANFYKLIPELRETWAKILAATPESFLVLMPFGPSWSHKYPLQEFIDILTAELTSHGVSADRIRVLKALPCRADVKVALKLGDIYLDSFPYSGTTSLIDPLETGLPAIAREGHTLRSRMGAAVLKSLPINELTVESEEEYIDLAVKLATTPGLRRDNREKIQTLMNNYPRFMDSHDYSTQLGNMFTKLLLKFRGKQAESIL